MQDSQMPEPDLISAAQSSLPPADEPAAISAGQLLRQAREAEHMHRASLAATLKVSVKKIEALENDDWQALPDLAFTRALASSICRQLKIDAQPILALLPVVRQQAPETPATLTEDKALQAARQKLSTSPAPRRALGLVWASAGLFILGAVAAAWWWQHQATERAAAVQELSHQAQAVEAQIVESEHTQPAVATPLQALPASAASDAQAALSSSPLPAVTSAAVAVPPSLTAVATAIAEPTASATPTPAPATALLPAGTAGVLELQAKAESWVQVRDAQNKLHVSRSLHAGDRVQVQGQPPYRLWTGRAEALQVFWQGAPVADFDGKSGALRVQIPAAAKPVVGGSKPAPASPQH